MVIRRIGQKHYQFVAADATEENGGRSSQQREGIEAEIHARAYRLWLKRDVRKDSSELYWLIDGRLTHDLAKLSYPKLLRIDRLLTRRLTETTGSRTSPVGDPSAHEKGTSALVLVVDDDQAVRDFVRYALEEQGYSVLIAPDAERALQTLDAYQGHVDLVISDIQMPGMGGGGLAACIRRGHPETHILLMSGMAIEDIPRQWRAAVISKPFRLDHLLARVKEALHVAVH